MRKVSTLLVLKNVDVNCIHHLMTMLSFCAIRKLPEFYAEERDGIWTPDAHTYRHSVVNFEFSEISDMFTLIALYSDSWYAIHSVMSVTLH